MMIRAKIQEREMKDACHSNPSTTRAFYVSLTLLRLSSRAGSKMRCMSRGQEAMLSLYLMMMVEENEDVYFVGKDQWVREREREKKNERAREDTVGVSGESDKKKKF